MPLCINNVQCDSPGLGGLRRGEHPEDKKPFQASCSLSQEGQVCFGVKYAEEGELLSPGALSLPQGLAVVLSPVRCCL